MKYQRNQEVVKIRNHIKKLYDNASVIIIYGSCIILKKDWNKRGSKLDAEWIYKQSSLPYLERQGLYSTEFNKAKRELLKKILLDSEWEEIRKDFYIENDEIISKVDNKTFVMGE